MTSARYLVGDVFDRLADLPDQSVDLVLTSPPFLRQRSYLDPDSPLKVKEVGTENTPADFIDRLLDVVEACSRVLTPHGSLAFELGDTFAGSGGAGGDYADGGLRDGQRRFDGSASAAYGLGAAPRPARTRSDGNGKVYRGGGRMPDHEGEGWPLDKSLCGIPTLFSWSLAYGRNLLRPERSTDRWRIRNLVVWCRPNPAVGALADKFRPGTSYITVATKARDRWFDLDAVRTPSDYERPNGAQRRDVPGKRRNMAADVVNPAGAPPLDHWWHGDSFPDDAWLVSTSPYKGSHYATWPPDLLVRPIKAMCPERVCRACGLPSRPLGEGAWSDCGHGDWRPGVVLDPFAGTGTTLAVATGHGRDAIGIDLDPANVDLARQRVGMFLDVDGPPPTSALSPTGSERVQ